MRIIGANSARCASARAHGRSSRPTREVDVEQVFPRPPGHRPRLELGQIDVAQREHAQRLEQRARLVRQREDDRGLVGGAFGERRRGRSTRNRVMLSSKSWIADASGVEAEHLAGARRGDRRRVASCPLARPSWRCRRCRRSPRSRRPSACGGTARTAPAPADASRPAARPRASCRAAPAGGARPAAPPRRRSAGRARAAGRSCGGCCRRSSSRSAARRRSPARRRPRRRRPRSSAGQRLGVGVDLPRRRFAEGAGFSLVGDAHTRLESTWGVQKPINNLNEIIRLSYSRRCAEALDAKCPATSPVRGAGA